MSYVVIAASKTMLDTISNALVVTFVLQVDDYLGPREPPFPSWFVAISAAAVQIALLTLLMPSS